MPAEIYEQLKDKLDRYDVGYPASAGGFEMKILKKLFTEEEAALFLHLDFLTMKPAAAVAEIAGTAPEETAEILEKMAFKGLCFRYRKKDGILYAAVPFILGLFEFQLKRMDREFAGLFEEYFQDAFYKAVVGSKPLMRTVPVNESVEAEIKVAPYEDAREMVKGQKKIAVLDCVCQRQQQLLGKGPEKPMEVCLSFGAHAQFYLDIGNAREINTEEALKILEKAQAAGMVIQPDSAQNPAGLCNCLGDCCVVLRALRKFPRPADMVLSNYCAEIDPEECTSCGVCLDRCQMDAIIIEDRAVIDSGRCIGCGLCVGTCPAGAIRLARKAEHLIVIPPETVVEAKLEIAAARGKDLGPVAVK